MRMFNGIEFRTLSLDEPIHVLDQVRELDETAFADPELLGQIIFEEDDLSAFENFYVAPVGGTFIIGEKEGGVVAMGGISRYSEAVAELRRMRVRRDLQGNGVGRQLLGILEDKAAELGYKAIVLDTTAEQPRAVRLYEGNGYYVTRRETDGPLEVVYYQKDLLISRA